MSTISQSIPNLLSGISQQPDSRKRPGQVRDAVNAFPDFALGMLKRPGGEFVSKLYGANPSTTNKWFEILRDDNEKYIAQFAEGEFRVWNLKDGLLGKVDMQVGGTKPATYDYPALQAAANDLNTKTKLVGTRLEELKTAADVVDEKTTGLNTTFTELFETTTTYSVEVEETLHSGVILNKDGVYLVKDNGTVISNTTSMPANYQLGVERTAENLLLASKGYRVFSVEKETAPAATAQADLTAAESTYTTELGDYDSAVTNADTARTTYDSAAANNKMTTPYSGYLAGATADDIELLTLNDTTFVLNKKQTVGFTSSTTHNGTISPFQAHVTIIITSTTASYSVFVEGTECSVSGSSAGSAADIATDLAAEINGNTSATAVQIGPGVHISNSTAFDISVGSDTGADAMTLITNKTNNTSRLPLHTMNGYVLQVVNSEEVDIDDMYLEFKTDDGSSKGVGQWFETTKPGIKDELDPATMPHVLISKGDGDFEYKQYDWKKRLVGDNETNPVPSFVDFEIDHMFFYRNRMGFISGQNVILSKAGDLNNFWNTTAQAATDDDPIDISVGGKKPIFLHYVQPTSVGLVLYSTYEQFLLTTDSDILSPRSAKVNTMSNYECDPNVEAVSLGISHAFISKTPLYTRLFELLEISGDSPPLMADITNYVPELIPQSVDSLKVSTALNVVSLGETGKPDLYQYRFLNRSRDERVVNSWYKWQLAGNLLYQFFDASTLYAVVTDGTDVYVQSFDVAQSNEEGFLTLPTGEKTDVCLDMFNVNPHRTYNAATDKTTIELPYDVIPNRTFTVLTLGDISSVQYPTVDTGTAGSHTAELDGDLRGKNLIIGFLYDMTIDLPTLYKYRQSGDNNIVNDDVSSLIIHRLKVKTGLSGPVDYKVNIEGINSWTDTVTVTMPNEYNLNNVNMQASATHVVPIFQRTENLSIQIVGNTPFPVSLLGLDWEGKFNQRFYRRG